MRTSSSSRSHPAGTDGGTIRRTVLPGGLRLVTETVPGVRSAAFGIWVGVGSRDETPALAGTSHFLEHLLFKGTSRRGALEIATVMDAVGGEMNAFTAKEYTCYYARVLDEDLALAVDVVSDMVTSSLVSTPDVDSERGVVLEEISMHDDEPADAVHDVFAEALFGDHPLGRPIIGTVESINALTRAQVAGYYRRRYRPPAMVVSVAGNINHNQVERMVADAFADVLEPSGTPLPLRRVDRVPATTPGVRTQERPTEQANLVIGTQGLAREDPRRHALAVLSNALGGGMSSRLFQEVRERRGLAYSVYSFAAHHAETGTFGVYAGCAPGKVDEVLDVIRTELEAAAGSGVSDDEIGRAKGQLRSSLLLGLEDTGSRMTRLGKGELVHARTLTVGEVLDRIDAVTADDVREVAADVLRRPMALALVGPVESAPAL
ncbi:MAG: insulinase family protein [Actinomycetota bacterium]|nr:insulinase family protein [Actinomycetota bacterium]